MKKNDLLCTRRALLKNGKIIEIQILYGDSHSGIMKFPDSHTEKCDADIYADALKGSEIESAPAGNEISGAAHVPESTMSDIETVDEFYTTESDSENSTARPSSSGSEVLDLVAAEKAKRRKKIIIASIAGAFVAALIIAGIIFIVPRLKAAFPAPEPETQAETETEELATLAKEESSSITMATTESIHEPSTEEPSSAKETTTTEETSPETTQDTTSAAVPPEEYIPPEQEYVPPAQEYIPPTQEYIPPSDEPAIPQDSGVTVIS